MTIISRLLGFARDMVIAGYFGVSAQTDAFFVAFKIPNFLRRLFMEGAFANAFVPRLSALRHQGENGQLKPVIGNMTGTLALVFFVASLLGVVLAPIFIFIFAPGFLHHAEHFELSVGLLRLTFPYLFFISMTAFFSSVLNVYGHFTLTSLTPALLNIILIIAAVWIAPHLSVPVTGLALGVLIAGIVQLVFQLPLLIRLGLLPKPGVSFQELAVKQMMKGMLPAIFGVSVVQINLLIDTIFASFLPDGSVSWLYYSDRLVEFPLGVLGVAVASVILPSLSDHYAKQDNSAFSGALDWGLRWVFLLSLPAMLGLILLAEPIVSVLFEHQSFGEQDVVMAAKSLKAFAMGLVGFVLIKVLVPGFTARHDAVTPVRVGLYSVGLNVGLNYVLLSPLAHAGPALATSISAYLNALMLLWMLIRQGDYSPAQGWMLFVLRCILATAMMSLFLVSRDLIFSELALNLDSRPAQLILTVLLALLVYILSLLGLGMSRASLKPVIQAHF